VRLPVLVTSFRLPRRAAAQPVRPQELLPPRSVEHARRGPPVGTADTCCREATMHGLIYLIGLIVVIMAILSFFGLR
jgi:hypothetical protein